MPKLYSLTWLLAAVFLPLVSALAQRPAASPPATEQPGAALTWQTRAQWAPPGLALADYRVSSAYTDAAGITYAYPQQLGAGLPVYNQVVTLAFQGGRLRHHAGAFLPPAMFAGLRAAPAVPATTAVATALASIPAIKGTPRPVALGEAQGVERHQTFAPGTVARRPIEARLVWAVVQGQPYLAWNVNVELVATPDWLNIRVDAQTGRVLTQDNWTVNEAARPTTSRAFVARRVAPRPAVSPQQTALTSTRYYVVAFPGERPDVSGLSFDTDPWTRAGANNPSGTYGWQYDGTTTYTDTRGNNVWAYDDSLDTDAPGRFASATSTGNPVTFQHLPDFTKSPYVTKNRRAGTVNLFYWNNLMHDVFYQYGFTEAAGNFQSNNLNRGGAGSDYVHAEAQDGSGTDNANFTTPPDGTSGWMQMYLWYAGARTTVQVTAPAASAGTYNATEGQLSAKNLLSATGPVSGNLVLYNDPGTGGTHLACTSPSSASLTGKIAIIYRGTCTFTSKIYAAQQQGAKAVIVINNTSGTSAMGGSNNTITIPAVMVSPADGATLVAQLAGNGTVTVTLAQPQPPFDSSYDDGIVSHEYGHGISNRLTGGGINTSCLDNAEQAGEGWSDYCALMMTTDWAATPLTDGSRSRGVDTYVAGQAATAGGIRRYPYTTNMSVNPLTYADMAGNTEVHATGTIWCSALWDMTWAIIQQQGTIEPNLYNSAGTGGNTVALRLVVQGLKLQPCQPGFLDSRDAILAADSLLYGGQYHCAIWGAFARRGMGFSAREGSANSATDQTAAYDVPGVALHKNTALVIGSSFTINLSASSACQAPGATYTLTDRLPADLQYVSSTGGGTFNSSTNTVSFSNLSFAAGQTRTFQIQAQAAVGKGCLLATPVYDDRETNTSGGFVAAVVTSGNAWAPSTARAHSGTTAWHAGDPNGASNVTLTSAAFTPGSASVLSFYHYLSATSTLNGGLVALSTDNGATWQDAAPYFVQNGYNAAFDSYYPDADIQSKPCFSGLLSKGTGPAAFVQTTLNLASFSGQAVRVRFQMRTSYYPTPSSPYEGWYLDDIQVLNGCGGVQQVQLTSGNTVLDSYLTPTFLLPLPLVLTGVSPTTNTIAATASSNLVLTFNQPVAAATAGNVRAYSSQRGGQLVRSGGAALTGGGTATLTIDPAVDFRPGETVRVSVPATVQTPTGVPARPQVYQFTAGVSAASPGTFGNNATQAGFSATARSLATADFNNDGRLDVLVVGRGSTGNVSLALGTSTGTLAAPTLLSIGSDLTAVVPADFNEDGNLDFAAVQNVIGNGVAYIRLGTGSGTFTSAANVALGSGARIGAVADVNNDGHLDLLTTNQAGNSVSVCLGAGNGTFTVATPLAGLTTAESLAVGDVNNDGRADLVASNFASAGQVYVRLGNGDGTFGSSNTLVVTGSPRGLVLADLNADGNLDLAVAGFTNPGYLSVRLGDGAGGFAGGADLPAGTQPGTVSAGDLDGDGDLDLFTIETAAQARYYLNNGSGTFTAAPPVPVSGSLSAHALADMDGDGDLDAVTVSDASTNTATATVVYNRPELPTLTQLTPASGPLDTGVLGTGTNLLVLRSVLLGGVPAPVTAAATAGQVSFVVPRQASTGRVTVATPAGQALGPVFTVTRPSTSDRFPGGALLVTPGGTALQVSSYVAPVVADLDGNGRLELLVGTHDGQLARYEQSATNSPNFLAQPYLQNAAGTNLSVASGSPTLTDLDGNGRLDLLVGENGNVRRFEQTAAHGLAFIDQGLLTDGTAALDVAGQGAAAPTITDLDGDGLLDLLAGNYDGQLLRFEQTAPLAATFAVQPLTTGGAAYKPGINYTHPAITDLDGDGLLDMLLGTGTGDLQRLEQVSTGSSDFTDLGTLTTNGTIPVSFYYGAPAVTDLDGDGLLDVVVGNSDGNFLRFEQAPTTPLPVQLTTFTAQAQSPAAVAVAWTTASETNSARFEVERSADGVGFARIGQVAAAGTSLTSHAYSLLDAHLPVGGSLLYYRLRQVDQDGTAAYSPVRTVALGGAGVGLSLYPNPARLGAMLIGAAPGTAVRVLDALGRQVALAAADASGTAWLALPAGLASGLYVVQAGAQTAQLVVE